MLLFCEFEFSFWSGWFVAGLASGEALCCSEILPDPLGTSSVDPLAVGGGRLHAQGGRGARSEGTVDR